MSQICLICLTREVNALRTEVEHMKRFEKSVLYLLHEAVNIFTARCYASAVLAMALCPSVCPSQVGVLLKRLNIGLHKQHHTIAQGL